MTEKIETVFFAITGEFVTKTARDWLYAENRPREKVIDFLLSALEGTDLDNKTLIKYTNDILTGKKKMIGNTRDNSYCMVDDDTDIIKQYPQYFENKPMAKPVIDDDGNVDDGFLQNLKALERRVHKAAQKIKPKKDITIGDFGWLRPDGKFFEVEWGKHESWAIEYVEKHYPGKNIIYAGDFLKEKGWLLFHSPGGGSYVNIFMDDIQSATNRQKEFLYDYFLERGRNNEANMIWKEDQNA
jgi:hypothetical protein